MATAAPRPPSKEMAHLLQQQNQIRGWLQEVDQRILDLETAYLINTPMGNVVRGWDIDAKPIVGRPRVIEDKERLFSQSSYRNWLSSRATGHDADEKKKTEQVTAQKSKRMRKSKSSSRIADDEWDTEF